MSEERPPAPVVRLVEPPKADTDIVAMLEKFLGMARAGKLVAVCLVYEARGQGTAYERVSLVESSRTRMIGELEIAKHTLAQRLAEESCWFEERPEPG